MQLCIIENLSYHPSLDIEFPIRVTWQIRQLRHCPFKVFFRTTHTYLYVYTKILTLLKDWIYCNNNQKKTARKRQDKTVSSTWNCFCLELYLWASFLDIFLQTKQTVGKENFYFNLFSEQFTVIFLQFICNIPSSRTRVKFLVPQQNVRASHIILNFWCDGKGSFVRFKTLGDLKVGWGAKDLWWGAKSW